MKRLFQNVDMLLSKLWTDCPNHVSLTCMGAPGPGPPMNIQSWSPVSASNGIK